MNENEKENETTYSVSENSIQIPLDKYAENITVVLEVPDDHEDVKTLLEDIKAALQSSDARLSEVSDDVADIKRETVSANTVDTVSKNSILDTPLSDYDLTDQLNLIAVLFLFGVLLYVIFYPKFRDI